MTSSNTSKFVIGLSWFFLIQIQKDTHSLYLDVGTVVSSASIAHVDDPFNIFTITYWYKPYSQTLDLVHKY